jgi:glycosyltransferase involved in cell wall biosynthesis
MSKLSVSQLNTFPYGGAATASLRTHAELLRQGVDSRYFWFRDQRGDAHGPNVNQLKLETAKTSFLSSLFAKKKQRRRQREIHALFDTHLEQRDSNLETFSMARLPEPSILPAIVSNSDVVHLHWISFFADYPSFFKSIAKHVPIVWTLHDMNPFTGGCHYSGGCERFKSGCGSCPQIVAPDPQDVSVDSFEAKRAALSGRQIHVTAPSQWMLDLAKQSPVWPASTTFTKIHLGFDLDTFFPVNRDDARKELGIETDAVLVAFGADDLNSKRKGFHHLLSALKRLKTDRNVECLVFGGGDIPDHPNLPRIHHQGFIDSADRQRLVYSASDLVVVPSREDNQPQVGLEAMACGVPVVAFDAGGIPEYVRDRKTGCLVPLGDEASLAEKISGLCDLESLRRRLGEAALAMVKEEFELSHQTQIYNVWTCDHGAPGYASPPRLNR